MLSLSHPKCVRLPVPEKHHRGWAKDVDEEPESSVPLYSNVAVCPRPPKSQTESVFRQHPPPTAVRNTSAAHEFRSVVVRVARASSPNDTHMFHTRSAATRALISSVIHASAATAVMETHCCANFSAHSQRTPYIDGRAAYFRQYLRVRTLSTRNDNAKRAAHVNF